MVPTAESVVGVWVKSRLPEVTLSAKPAGSAQLDELPMQKSP